MTSPFCVHVIAVVGVLFSPNCVGSQPVPANPTTKTLEDQRSEQLRLAVRKSLQMPRRGRERLKDFIDSHPTSNRIPTVRRRFVGTYVQEDRPDEALDALLSLTDVNLRHPDYSNELVAIAHSYARLNRPKEGIGLLSAALEQMPNVVSFHMALGEIYANGNEEQMVVAYESAAKLKHPPAIRRLAEYFTSKKQWHQASEYWNKWQPANTWCGTCNASLDRVKRQNQFACYMYLEQYEDALALVESFGNRFRARSPQPARPTPSRSK